MNLGQPEASREERSALIQPSTPSTAAPAMTVQFPALHRFSAEALRRAGLSEDDARLGADGRPVNSRALVFLASDAAPIVISGIRARYTQAEWRIPE